MKRAIKSPFLVSFVLSLALAVAPLAQASPFTETAPMNLDGYLSVVITTAAGTTDLNNVNVTSGALTKAGAVKKAAPYSLGVLAKSTHSSAPLPVILLSENKASVNSIQRGYGIGVLKYTKGGKPHQALIAVGQGSSQFAGVHNMETLQAKQPKAWENLQAWLTSAYGASKISTESRVGAINLAGESILAYIFPKITEADRRPMDADGNPTLLHHPKSRNIHKE